MKQLIFSFLIISFISIIFIHPKSYAQEAPVTPVPEPTWPVSTQNPFNYTPLPVNTGGPAGDISEVGPLTANRTSAQVDDYITFTATIQDRAPYNKTLQNVCFESSDGNFGCKWDIELTPGQTYTINNLGNWTSPGTKNVWITWTQDGINYYRPVNGRTARVFIVD
jgi:hypothetical protein